MTLSDTFLFLGVVNILWSLDIWSRGQKQFAILHAGLWTLFCFSDLEGQVVLGFLGMVCGATSMRYFRKKPVGPTILEKDKDQQ